MVGALAVQPGDVTLEDAFLARVADLLELTAGVERGISATTLLEWLQACALDVTAIRDVDVWLMRDRQKMSGPKIGTAFGVSDSRGAQLIARAGKVHDKAEIRVGQLRRRVRRGGLKVT